MNTRRVRLLLFLSTETVAFTERLCGAPINNEAADEAVDGSRDIGTVLIFTMKPTTIQRIARILKLPRFGLNLVTKIRSRRAKKKRNKNIDRQTVRWTKEIFVSFFFFLPAIFSRYSVERNYCFACKVIENYWNVAVVFFSVYPMGDKANNYDAGCGGGDDDDVHSVYRLNWHFKDEDVLATCADCLSLSSTSGCAVLCTRRLFIVTLLYYSSPFILWTQNNRIAASYKNGTFDWIRAWFVYNCNNHFA